MGLSIQPASVVLEFLTWFACWVGLMALQRELCRRHPGLRTVCRMIFLSTLVVALVPGICTLVFRPAQGPPLVGLFNHAFGIGVLAQTSMRSLLLVRWLVWPGSPYSGAGAPLTPGTERLVLAWLPALTQLMRSSGESPAPARLAPPRTAL